MIIQLIRKSMLTTIIGWSFIVSICSGCQKNSYSIAGARWFQQYTIVTDRFGNDSLVPTPPEKAISLVYSDGNYAEFSSYLMMNDYSVETSLELYIGPTLIFRGPADFDETFSCFHARTDSDPIVIYLIEDMRYPNMAIIGFSLQSSDQRALCIKKTIE